MFDAVRRMRATGAAVLSRVLERTQTVEPQPEPVRSRRDGERGGVKRVSIFRKEIICVGLRSRQGSQSPFSWVARERFGSEREIVSVCIGRRRRLVERDDIASHDFSPLQNIQPDQPLLRLCWTGG